MSDSAGLRLYLRIREVNRTGRLYPLPAAFTLESATMLEWLLVGLVWLVPATGTSAAGYAAVGSTGIGALRREWQD